MGRRWKETGLDNLVWVIGDRRTLIAFISMDLIPKQK